MSIKSNIQQGLILKTGQKKHQRLHIKKNFVSLKDARSIGIIADLRNEQSINPINNFFSKIKNKEGKYKILLLVDKKREDINQYDYEKLFPGAMVILVSSGDYSFFGVAKKNIIAPFITGKFDLFFRLGLGSCFEIDMVLLATHATMYAGHDDPGLSFLDFRITLAHNASIESLCSNLLVYMAKLDQNSKASDSKDFTLF
ncbi:MAG: hypothetical protein J7L96_02855 [Bacteroidales bacterium]|nr:hypothetical protein [Bacteroidales bacterium]